MKLKNKINTPSLWGYFPTGLVPLTLWGDGYGVRMRYGVRDDLCWWELLCCSWWNTTILLNSPKPCDLPNPKTELGQMKCPCIFFGWQYFNLDPVFHRVASWRHTRAKKGVSDEWGSTSRSRERTGVLFIMASTTQFWWYQDWKHGSLVLPFLHLSTWRSRETLWELQSAGCHCPLLLCFSPDFEPLTCLCF